MSSNLKQRIRREQFQPTWLGAIINGAFIIRRGLFKAISRQAPHLSGSVLDFGCGSKPYETLFTAATEYVGVDIEQSGHDHRTSKVDVFYDGTTLPFDADRFDGVVAFEVFEHVFNLDEVLTEISRVLKPGGQLLFTIPFAWQEHEQPYDFARYTSFGITSVLQAQGYRDIVIEKTNSTVAAVGQIAIAYVAERILPRATILNRIGQLAIVFPMTVMTIAAEKILPRSDTFYSNLVVRARR